MYKLEESVRRWRVLGKAGVQHPVDARVFKLKAYALADACGIRHVKVLGEYRDISEVDWRVLPSRVVLKLHQGHSSHGVRLLERVEDGFNDLRRDELLTQSAISDWIGAMGSSGFWLEEMLYPLPVDWKCYAFNGRIGLVTRIDREHNTYQTYDGDLRPTQGAFWGHIFRETDCAARPKHPEELLKAARAVSAAVRYPHCSVDLYDMTDGVYLGEVTALPGAGRRISADWDIRLGAMWEEAETELILAGYPPFYEHVRP